MVLKRRDGDLCKAYRPLTFSEIVGQTAVIKSIKNSIKSEGHSHCYLLHGERGCGKTSTARIMAMALNCTDIQENGDPCCTCENCVSIYNDSHPDIKEINAADTGGKDKIRQILQDLKSLPMFGKIKMYILDEAHKITSAAQEQLLKGTEDMPNGVYIILCSTEPTKIVKTLKDRCEDYKFKKLPNKKIREFVETVGLCEGFQPAEKVLNAITHVSDGRPRNALRSLQKVMNLKNEPENYQLEILEYIDEESGSVAHLCNTLYASNRNITWPYIMKLYKAIEMDAVSLKLILAGFFRGKLERTRNNKEASRAAKCLGLFMEDYPVVRPENKLVSDLYNAYTILKE